MFTTTCVPTFLSSSCLPSTRTSMSRRSPLQLGQLLSQGTDSYVCPSCLLTRAPRASRNALRKTKAEGYSQHRALHNDAQQARRGSTTPGSPRRLQCFSATGKRRNATLASSTAINAPSTVPPHLRELHQRLNALQESASAFLDLSRLQLALRSLENTSPVTRIALLGLGVRGVDAAKKLARVLLADALGEEEEWERILLEDAGDGRSLLLRYGDAEDAKPAESPLVRTLLIPSPFLRRHGMEIMITGLNAGGLGKRDRREMEGALLVPSLSMPNSTGGRVGFVRYPVHKAMVVGDGVEGAVECAKVLGMGLEEGLVGGAVDLPMIASSSAIDKFDSTRFGQMVNVDTAITALNLFRKDKANGARFSDGWEASRVSAIADWLALSNAPTHAGLKQAVLAQVNSVISSLTEAIDRVEKDRIGEIARATVPEPKRAELQSAISAFSAEAHKDLQLNVNTALVSKSWRRTAWFRILWRIDDVSYSAADVLRQSWLKESEQSLAFLSGRVLESGLATADQLKESGGAQQLLDQGIKEEMQTYEAVKDRKESVAELMQLPTLLSRVREQSGVNAFFDPPWPQTISLARVQMLHELVPALHRKAQTLLASTLTTVGGSTALGAWLWVASSGTALYEAGAIAALGTVWAARRLQKLWGREREGFEGRVREDGRRVLAELESGLRKVVGEGGRVGIREEDVRGWAKARDGVKGVQQAVDELKA